MIKNATIRDLIETAVAESIDEHLRALHEGVVSRVMESIGPSLEARDAGCSTEELNSGVNGIQRVFQQVDILKAFLDGAAAFSARTALFILRGNMAVGWQARGFENDDAIKAVTIDSNASIFGNVIHAYAITKVNAEEFDSKFSAAMGLPLDGRCVLVPLIVRGKVAAVLYADSGDEAITVDEHALDLLARAAGDWIELQALRKAVGAPTHYPRSTQPVETDVAIPPAPERPATAAPQVAAAAQGSGNADVSFATPGPSTAPTAAAISDAQTLRAVQPEAPAAAEPPAQPVPEPPAVPEVSSEEAELHKKARRFAKLLVDEIVLYNQSSVSAGREHHDLYDRLKEPIEKSRATFDKRYAQTSVASCDYFNHALIAGLADHNPSALGSNFPR